MDGESSLVAALFALRNHETAEELRRLGASFAEKVVDAVRRMVSLPAVGEDSVSLLIEKGTSADHNLVRAQRRLQAMETRLGALVMAEMEEGMIKGAALKPAREQLQTCLTEIRERETH